MMALVLNIVWVVFGGLLMSVLWCLAGVLAAITIIGLPWARACFAIAGFSLWPFGREAISRATLTGRDDLGTGPLGLLGNIVWVLLLGIWLALGHLASAVACALTIIGIPFAWQHIKLAGMSLAPIGITVVDKHIAAEARRRWASAEVDRMRK
jgi:uncharacterized membrane protein YccF (DUF307 family)